MQFTDLGSGDLNMQRYVGIAPARRLPESLLQAARHGRPRRSWSKRKARIRIWISASADGIRYVKEQSMLAAGCGELRGGDGRVKPSAVARNAKSRNASSCWRMPNASGALESYAPELGRDEGSEPVAAAHGDVVRAVKFMRSSSRCRKRRYVEKRPFHRMLKPAERSRLSRPVAGPVTVKALPPSVAKDEVSE